MASYLSGVPMYEYEMACGHIFRSHTPSVPILDEAPELSTMRERIRADIKDERMGDHYLYCTTCGDVRVILPEVLREAKPRREGGKRCLSDTEVSEAYDMAILKDRVASRLRSAWDAVPAEQVAEEVGVSVRTVKRVGADLGVYDSKHDQGCPALTYNSKGDTCECGANSEPAEVIQLPVREERELEAAA